MIFLHMQVIDDKTSGPNIVKNIALVIHVIVFVSVYIDAEGRIFYDAAHQGNINDPDTSLD